MSQGKTLILNWEKTLKIESSGFSILSVLTDMLNETQTRISHHNLSPSLAKEFHHPIFKSLSLERLTSKDHFQETPTSINMCIDGGFSPVFNIRFAEKFSFLSDKNIFHSQLILNELLQNATDHSGSERYYLYAEIKHDQLYLGVLDSGIGIPSKMSQKYNQPNDETYIEHSFKEGVSTRRLRTGGYGLYHTFGIVKNYEGNLVVLSHNGGIRRYFAQRKVVRLKLKNTLKGTWCFLNIKVGES